MITATIFEAKTKLSELVKKAQKGCGFLEQIRRNPSTIRQIKSKLSRTSTIQIEPT